MRIKMLTHMAGPEVSAHAGDEVDVDDKQATALIDGGYAQAVKVSAEQATTGPEEQAVDPPEKQATKAKPRKRRTRRS